MSKKNFKSDSIFKEMKGYENNVRLTEGLPVIIRIDGRHFHSFTRGMNRPFDSNVIEMMDSVAIDLCKDIQNCRLAYLQSDEISLVMVQNKDAMPWFDNDLQKICSISSSRASATANKWLSKSSLDQKFKDRPVMFDSRAFVIPQDRVLSYFIWRQKDWERNSIQMLARSLYSQKELHGKDSPELHDLIHDKGDNWAKLPTSLRRGRCCIKVKTSEEVDNPHFKGQVERSRWIIDDKTPIFRQTKWEEPNYILDRIKPDVEYVIPLEWY